MSQYGISENNVVYMIEGRHRYPKLVLDFMIYVVVLTVVSLFCLLIRLGFLTDVLGTATANTNFSSRWCWDLHTIFCIARSACFWRGNLFFQILVMFWHEKCTQNTNKVRMRQMRSHLSPSYCMLNCLVRGL